MKLPAGGLGKPKAGVDDISDDPIAQSLQQRLKAGSINSVVADPKKPSTSGNVKPSPAGAGKDTPKNGAGTKPKEPEEKK